MKFKTTSGVIKRAKTPKKYFIDWEGESKSKFQKNVKKFLFDFWRYDVVLEEFPIPGSRLSIDFFNVNKKIAVEVQGDQHIKYVPYFHQTKGNYLHQLRKDKDKENFCNINDIILVEIFTDDVISIDLFKKYNIDL